VKNKQTAIWTALKQVLVKIIVEAFHKHKTSCSMKPVLQFSILYKA